MAIKVAIVEDNGCGFDINQQSQSGNGLCNMEERMEDVEGTITIPSHRCGGTKLMADIDRPNNALTSGHA